VTKPEEKNGINRHGYYGDAEPKTIDFWHPLPPPGMRKPPNEAEAKSRGME